MSPDGSALRAKRSVSVPGAPPINGERVTEVAIALWCDDWGVMAVNGKVILQAGFQKPEAARMFVKSGDVITIEMTNNGGPMQLGFESFAGKQKFLTAQEFSYTHKPEKDWKTIPKFELGYRRPLWQVKRGMIIGDVENPTIALRQKEDEKYQKLYFKYVIR
ncbi:MAG: hypothetical protein KF712_17650 [Akkermansiaceae bacterium]|nr:hypothetical protein [Akkermansiaceae bacterium]